MFTLNLYFTVPQAELNLVQLCIHFNTTEVFCVFIYDEDIKQDQFDTAISQYYNNIVLHTSAILKYCLFWSLQYYRGILWNHVGPVYF